MGNEWIKLGIAIGGAILLGPVMGIAYGASIGFVGGSILGSMLFPTKSNLSMPEAASYPIQQSCKGVCISKIFGTNFIAGNILWMGELHPYKIRSSTGGGGKGGGDEGERQEPCLISK